MPPSQEIRGLVEHDVFYDRIVVERPLVSGMVTIISDAGRQAWGNKRFYCFACGALYPQPVWLSPRLGTFDHLDLYLANLFPNGCYSIRVTRIPGTRIRLSTALANIFCHWECIMTRFGIEWDGNVLVVKHRFRSDLVVHVRREEDEYAEVLLGL
ncbi:hypothetical protein C8F04DRAFT_1198877 [Mycena alexandri]|uniref:Uncharacterized protein n=1 Tax=Mycena alexandri TaxID=1745969 RepID=A0AAD6WMW0_9AGAR|nr:hypothetical protein C8F04DRAFT_1198877 [Mycena alexandri]